MYVGGGERDEDLVCVCSHLPVYYLCVCVCDVRACWLSLSERESTLVFLRVMRVLKSVCVSVYLRTEVFVYLEIICRSLTAGSRLCCGCMYCERG